MTRRKATRRDFVKGCLAAGLAFGWPRPARSAGANSDVRLALVGLGGIDVPGSVGGYLRTDLTGGKGFDNQDKEIKDFAAPKGSDTTVMHVTNFVEAVCHRDAGQLHAPAWEGHLSTACAHLANVSYRLGAESNPEAMRAAIRKAAPTAEATQAFADVFERYQEHLAAHGVTPAVTPGVLGTWVTLDVAREPFVGDFADRANASATRQYRAPFVVPTVT